MLAMHDHEPGPSNYMARSPAYHHPCDLGSHVMTHCKTSPSQYGHRHQQPPLREHPNNQHHRELQQQQQQQQQHPGPSQQQQTLYHSPHHYQQHESTSMYTEMYNPQFVVKQHVGQPGFPSSYDPQGVAATGSCSVYSEDEYEDVDDEEISEMDDEELRLSYEQYRRHFHPQPDVTSQLLQFANMVSADIQKFFGRTKDHEDGCDVYEDKWATTKSGRELYYADLLRIAQGDTEPVSKTTRKSFSSPSSSSSLTSLSPHSDPCRPSQQFTGRRDTAIGVGPLSELFEYGLQHFSNQKKHNHGNSGCRSRSAPGNKPLATPMHERNLPASFWREPALNVVFNDPHRMDVSQHAMMTTSKLPDFSDLVESWQGAGEGMSGSGHDRRPRLDVHLDHHAL
ncbi:unnamed protein product [Lymnaea stagnalis]|uniref:Uncharacterized protein n=1 Tax=Lymnaea stagnalis TaxID=6523 RepID=A0AAV2H6B9_LYMST